MSNIDKSKDTLNSHIFKIANTMYRIISKGDAESMSYEFPDRVEVRAWKTADESIHIEILNHKDTG